MVKKKGKSKRIALKDKYKIQRRVVESHRKSRKKAKRDAKAGIIKHDKKKKDPGIPNSWPFKEDLLNEIAKARDAAARKVEEAKERKREERLRSASRDGVANPTADETATTIEGLVARANEDQNAFRARALSAEGPDGTDRSDGTASHGQSSRRAYLRELRKVVDASDVLLQILDARDPTGTRASPAVEHTILSHSDKKMVLVLNKIDLVPKVAVSGWLTTLRKSHPTVAMKAGTSNRGKTSEHKSSVGRAKGENALSSSSAVDVEGLLGLLKNYARVSGGGTKKGTITVGVVGYPNVGKSSVINALKRCRAVGVSPKPGFTTSLQEVVLDRSVRLLDCPGVVFDDGDASGGALLRNCLDTNSLSDPIPAVEALIGRCAQESLLMTYGIPAFPPGDVMSFLALVARVNGRVGKGGIPDKTSAARTVLKDWNEGKIPYFTPPPMADDGAGTSMSDVSEGRDAVVVSQLGEEFDVGKMAEKINEEVMETLEEDVDEMDFVQLKHPSTIPARRTRRLSDENGEDEQMHVDDDIEHQAKESTMSRRGRRKDAKKNSSVAASENARMADAEDYDFDAM